MTTNKVGKDLHQHHIRQRANIQYIQRTQEVTPISRQGQLHKYFLNAGEFACLFICMAVCLVFQIDNELVYYRKIDSSSKHQNHESSCLWLEMLDQYSYTFRRQYTPAAFFLSFHNSRQLEEKAIKWQRLFWRKGTYRPISEMPGVHMYKKVSNS